MKDKIKEYKHKLEGAIMEYMSMPASERSSSAITAMLGCWDALDDMARKISSGDGCDWTIKAEDDAKWNSMMKNADGTSGGHWTVDQTNGVAQNIGVVFQHVTAEDFNVAMNMMYSDYGTVASYYGVASAEFFGEMAKAFLFDKDGPMPKEKLGAYYHCIVCAADKEKAY